LLVDDEPSVLRIFGRILEHAGYGVTRCSNGSEALVAMGASSFDVIVSDICMPELGGIDLIKAVRRYDLDVPVLLVTGHPVLDTAIAALECGALQYLFKPIEPAALCASVARACTLHGLAVAKRQAQELQGMLQGAPGDRASREISFDNALVTLWLAFQPVTRRDGSIAGYEAFLRSQEPTLPNPEAIIGAAERLGRLNDLGRSIRAAAAREFGRAPSGAMLFLNLHAHDLEDGALYDASEPLNARADRIVFEITERASLDAVKDLPARVAALRKRGFRIAVDDLGAGYAGLTSFALLEPEFVKLDTSLIRGVDGSSVKQSVIGCITKLCHELEIQVVSEGVETVAERDLLRELDCDLFQGYLFARPTEGFSDSTGEV